MLRHFVVVSLYFFLFFFFIASASSQGRPGSAMQGQPSLAVVPAGSASEQLQREQAGRLFIERQRQLRVDTQKLVALTAELKEQVDKTNVNILSMDVVKKAAEIQKLAKSVQDKMKNGY
jgi:hypothetical protein